ncbi:MAG: hypothetical protein EOO41_03165, partial [Methanobacteriota archaeon]
AQVTHDRTATVQGHTSSIAAALAVREKHKERNAAAPVVSTDTPVDFVTLESSSAAAAAGAGSTASIVSATGTGTAAGEGGACDAEKKNAWVSVAHWAEAIAAVLTRTGYDLISGVAVSVAMPSYIQRADDDARYVRARLSALFLRERAPCPLARTYTHEYARAPAVCRARLAARLDIAPNSFTHPPRMLKECVRGMASLHVSRIQTALPANLSSLPQVASAFEQAGVALPPASAAATVVSIPQFEAQHVVGSASDGPVVAAVAACSTSVAASSWSADSVTQWVDLSSGSIPNARDAASPDLDGEFCDALLPVSTLRANYQRMLIDNSSSLRLAVSFNDTSVPGVVPRVGFYLERFPVFLRGRYCKYARNLSQTPWVLQGVRIGSAQSVEEIIGNALLLSFSAAVPVADEELLNVHPFALPANEVVAHEPKSSTCAKALLDAAFAAPQSVWEGEWCAAFEELLTPANYDTSTGVPYTRARPAFRFHAAGREDIDVRMLGPGRPYMLELIDTKHVLIPPAVLPALQQVVNSYAFQHGDTVEVK